MSNYKTIPRMAIVRPAKDTITRLRAVCAMCRQEISPLETYQLFEGNPECNKCNSIIVRLLDKEQQRA